MVGRANRLVARSSPDFAVDSTALIVIFPHHVGLGCTRDLERRSFTAGTTIRRGIETSLARNSMVSYTRDASGAKGADVVIVVVGERPYAEGNGDRKSPALDDEDQRTLRTAQASGAKVVLVVVAGRPLLLGEFADSVDALVAAWLPGTEGAGVADVLFGRVKPTGKLSRTWPRTIDQIPLNAGDPNCAPLFP